MRSPESPEPDHDALEQQTGTPRWVVVTLVVVGLLLLLLVAVALLGGHQGGPGRHTGLPGA